MRRDHGEELDRLRQHRQDDTDGREDSDGRGDEQGRENDLLDLVARPEARRDRTQRIGAAAERGQQHDGNHRDAAGGGHAVERLGGINHEALGITGDRHTLRCQKRPDRSRIGLNLSGFFRRQPLKTAGDGGHHTIGQALLRFGLRPHVLGEIAAHRRRDEQGADNEPGAENKRRGQNSPDDRVRAVITGTGMHAGGATTRQDNGAAAAEQIAADADERQYQQKDRCVH
ncbi:hypothetical protein D3C72_1291460 [compost metagenome]